MLMQAPTGGDSFVGNDGFTYAASSGASTEIGNAAVRQAFQRNWSELPYPPVVAPVQPPLFNVTATATLATTQNDYVPAGWVGGTTSRCVLTPAGGGSTITGLDATNVPDGWTVLLVNPSATDTITFPHLSGSSLVGNRFSCASGASVSLAPLANAYANRHASLWKFA
jgi:hypothetical protein